MSKTAGMSRDFLSGKALPHHISVSMKDKDYVGPEAASYSPKQGNIIVFN
jgi:hypothetical protein